MPYFFVMSLWTFAVCLKFAGHWPPDVSLMVHRPQDGHATGMHAPAHARAYVGSTPVPVAPRDGFLVCP